ncbi:ATP-binding protein [Streptomyces sp. NPDC049837]|uniref:ATP-binding protein n=1 Tax=Streptomyces sp. NPDC049837 TaxID=3155277 RepID=UPI0034462936
MTSVVPRVRASVRSALEEWDVSPERTEALVLAVTELVSNAIRHVDVMAGRLRVTVTFSRGWLQLDVADGDPRLPRIGLDADMEAESGRGLMILGFLACEAGGELAAFRTGPGKVVRVRVPAT